MLQMYFSFSTPDLNHKHISAELHDELRSRFKHLNQVCWSKNSQDPPEDQKHCCTQHLSHIPMGSRRRRRSTDSGVLVTMLQPDEIAPSNQQRSIHADRDGRRRERACWPGVRHRDEALRAEPSDTLRSVDLNRTSLF
ncbi:hypothetical protein ILYODFUR_026513 [Ilyodon furcidens]|uniref:Uncharacterized protein n=1 Tax=Ilyodon furcidens TaxID=33524 RepID=A0ABV0SSI7_9TELE